MKITSVAVHACRLPPASPWEDATNKVQGLEFIFTEMMTDTGLSGIGLSYTVDVGGTAIATLIEDYLAPLVIGLDPLDYERIWSRLHRQSRRLGLGVNSMAIAALDIAIWDIIGKHHGQPLHKLLGGARDTIPVYISEINLRAEDTPADLVRRIDDYVAQGYRAVKVKIGRDDIEEDVERIIRAKERLGRGGRLMVDLNQKWTTAEALSRLPHLDPLGLGWIEEPLNCHDVAGHSSLRCAMKTPLALGESLYSRTQFLEYLRADAIDIVQADVAFVGGVTEWHKIAHLAASFSRPVAPHYMMELSLPLLCGVNNAFMLENVVGGALFDLGLVRTPVRIENGVATPSPLPGHGLAPDWDNIRARKLTGADVRKGFSGGSK